MSSKQVYDPEYARQIAIEQQLMAEEKWVMEALNNIKTQRNNLQVERLYLSGLLGNIVMKRTGDFKMAAAEQESSKQEPVQPLPSFSMHDKVCNVEELNLTIPQHKFHKPTSTELERLEEFENAQMDYEIDINMMMSGLDGVM